MHALSHCTIYIIYINLFINIVFRKIKVKNFYFTIYNCTTKYCSATHAYCIILQINKRQ